MATKLEEKVKLDSHKRPVCDSCIQRIFFHKKKSAIVTKFRGKYLKSPYLHNDTFHEVTMLEFFYFPL
jgi:tRNA U54 and U55 pseudouridine synthase Pus10